MSYELNNDYVTSYLSSNIIVFPTSNSLNEGRLTLEENMRSIVTRITNRNYVLSESDFDLSKLSDNTIKVASGQANIKGYHVICKESNNIILNSSKYKGTVDNPVTYNVFIKLIFDINDHVQGVEEIDNKEYFKGAVLVCDDSDISDIQDDIVLLGTVVWDGTRIIKIINNIDKLFVINGNRVNIHDIEYSDKDINVNITNNLQTFLDNIHYTFLHKYKEDTFYGEYLHFTDKNHRDSYGLGLKPHQIELRNYDVGSSDRLLLELLTNSPTISFENTDSKFTIRSNTNKLIIGDEENKSVSELNFIGNPIFKSGQLHVKYPKNAQLDRMLDVYAKSNPFDISIGNKTYNITENHSTVLSMKCIGTSMGTTPDNVIIDSSISTESGRKSIINRILFNSDDNVENNISINSIHNKYHNSTDGTNFYTNTLEIHSITGTPTSEGTPEYIGYDNTIEMSMSIPRIIIGNELALFSGKYNVLQGLSIGNKLTKIGMATDFYRNYTQFMPDGTFQIGDNSLRLDTESNKLTNRLVCRRQFNFELNDLIKRDDKNLASTSTEARYKLISVEGDLTMGQYPTKEVDRVVIAEFFKGGSTHPINEDNPDADKDSRDSDLLILGNSGAIEKLEDGRKNLNRVVDVAIGRNLDVKGVLNVVGTITGSKVFNAVYNDYADNVLKDKTCEYEPGDIISKKPNSNEYTLADRNNRKLVVGVYSDTFGHLLGGDEGKSMEENEENYIPIGVCGNVRVKVIGEIHEGDLITVSLTPGVGISCDKYEPGTIIGKALETSYDLGIKRVLMQIMLL